MDPMVSHGLQSSAITVAPLWNQIHVATLVRNLLSYCSDNEIQRETKSRPVAEMGAGVRNAEALSFARWPLRSYDVSADTTAHDHPHWLPTVFVHPSPEDRFRLVAVGQLRPPNDSSDREETFVAPRGESPATRRIGRSATHERMELPWQR